MGAHNLISLNEPKSPVTEAYRTLKTNIRFSSLDNNVKSILVTSSGPGEGKTTTASNLAVTIAQGGSRVIIVDCDLRKPNLHKLFRISNQSGLCNLLVGEIEMNAAIKSTEVNNLFVMTSGVKPPNPVELLESMKMRNLIEKLKKSFDYVILDTPPIVLVTDAQVLSKYVDGSLLVVALGEADLNAVVMAKQLLENVDSKIIGVVANKLDNSRGLYNYYYNYYYYEGGKKKRTKGRKRKSRFGASGEKEKIDV